jgi:hypothetical protein
MPSTYPTVMAGLVPAISLRGAVPLCPPKRAARVKPAHDGRLALPFVGARN